MHYTTTEAAAHLCPLTLGRERRAGLEQFDTCRGRDCMGWRQTHDGTRGFCGFAGDPVLITINHIARQRMAAQLAPIGPTPTEATEGA